MHEVVSRMRRVSEDLREISARLEQIRAGQSADPQVVAEVLQLDLIREFKASIDQMRSFLWEYFQQTSIKNGPGPDRALREFRLKRAAEMLRSVQDEVVMPRGPEHASVTSLFERLQNIADVAVERHFIAKSEASE